MAKTFVPSPDEIVKRVHRLGAGSQARSHEGRALAAGVRFPGFFIAPLPVGSLYLRADPVWKWSRPGTRLLNYARLPELAGL